jgi:hypothetical protein
MKVDWKEESPYSAALAAGIQIDSHESDLYIKGTPEAFAIVKRTGASYSTFRSNIDRETWIDVPFAYLPWWEARATK